MFTSQGYEPTVPKNNRTNDVFSFQTGQFIFEEKTKELSFIDQQQKRHDPKNTFTFLSKHWNSKDSQIDLPRPSYVDKDGNVTETGDVVIYVNLYNRADNILILGTLQDLGAEQAYSFDIEDYYKLTCKKEIKANKKRTYEVVDDGAGNIEINITGNKNDKAEETGTGNIKIKVKGTEKNGNFDIECNGKVSVSQKDPKGENDINKIILDNSEGKELITIEGKKHINIKAKTFDVETDSGKLSELIAKLVDTITKMTLSHPMGATLPTPITMSDFVAFKEDIKKFSENK